MTCLEKRYPFRLLPNLPPKRVGINGAHAFADENFIERRRRGLQRAATFLANHPTLKTDSLVNTFFTEQSDLQIWRKTANVSLEEESVSRQLTAADEMGIPSNLELRLAAFRERLPQLIELWTKTCQTVERIIKRRELQSQDFNRLAEGFNSIVLTEQSSPTSSTSTYRPADNDILDRELGQVSDHLSKYGDIIDNRCHTFSSETLERLKSHRELFSDFGHLLLRHDRFAPDAVDKLNRRGESSKRKLETLRKEKKPKWEIEE